MRMTTAVLFPLLVLALCSSGCTGQSKADLPPPAASEAPPPTWPVKMQAMSEALSSLLPLVASRTKFADEKNLPKIEASTRTLRGLAHSLSKGSIPNNDPGMQIMSERFQEDVDRALESLQSGNRDYARSILKDTTAYCVQCHTASNNGPEFPRLNLKINLADLNPLERAEFFTATRQFDSAIEEYMKILSDERLARLDPFEWERAARSALAIVVRVKNDPKAAMSVIEKIHANRSAPRSMKEALSSWTQAAREWATEKRPASPSAEAQIAIAETLIAKAGKRQSYPLDHSQDLLYFRASSLLSDLLSGRTQTDLLTAKALYLSGLASEATRDMNFWTLHETYYERCIQVAPQTDIARQCFDKLNDSVILGYSGSSGLRIPPEVKRHLGKLKELAYPPNQGPSSEGD